MLEDGVPFEQHLAILATLLMDKHGDRIVVTYDEIQRARLTLTEHQVQMVAWDNHSSAFGSLDEVVIEFRHRSRRVIPGQVVA